VEFSLPVDLPHDMDDGPVIRGGERTRYADGYSNRHHIIHEAKCYAPIRWNPNARWMYFAAIGFGLQMFDYINEAQRLSRTGTGTVVRYHFCVTPPQWALKIMLLFGAGHIASGLFDFRYEDLAHWFGEANSWIDEPCLELQGVVAAIPTLYFECAMGLATGDEPEQGSAVLACASSGYDIISCSE
jgi:hypothetical protein